MKQSIGLVALVVRDYDKAIEFYVDRLGFSLIEDTPVEAQNKRWVVVAPSGSSASRLLLARAVGDEQSWPKAPLSGREEGNGALRRNILVHDTAAGAGRALAG